MTMTRLDIASEALKPDFIIPPRKTWSKVQSHPERGSVVAMAVLDDDCR